MADKLNDLGIDVRTYEIDLAKGIAKAENAEDHQRMMEALTLIKSMAPPTPSIQRRKLNSVGSGGETEKNGSETPGMTFTGLFDKFLTLKKIKESTIQSYRITVEEFTDYIGKRRKLFDIMKIDVSNYQEHLSLKGNNPRTIDNKVGIIRTLYFFAIKQGYFFGENPAANRNLVSKREKLTSGYAIFEEDEIENIFKSEFFKKSKEEDPDYYWTLMIGFLTGCRISEITALTREQFKKTDSGTHYIKVIDAKTFAGKRDVPIPPELMSMGLESFLPKEGQVFKYQMRLGKGSGNAVGKKFKRHLEELNIKRGKLVFHSIRKFTNDYLLKSSVPFEPRCQYLGHEIDNVNVATYSKKFNADNLAEVIFPVHQKMMKKFLDIGKG